VVGGGQVRVHQLEEGAGEPFGRPEGEMVDGPERQQAFDGQVAVLELCSLPSRSLIPLRFQGLLLDPEGGRAPADEGVVVLLPVADTVDKLLRGRASGHLVSGAMGARGGGPPITPVY
jgi:hypothetical protein